MHRSFLGLVITPFCILFLALTFSACNQSSAPTDSHSTPAVPPQTITVVMKNMEFTPPSVDIHKGDTVEWKNEDITPHTATGESFDSGAITASQTWKHTFNETGSIPYACTFHPPMKGTINVQ